MTLRRMTQLSLMGLALLITFSSFFNLRLDHDSPLAQDLFRGSLILGLTLLHAAHKQARELPSLSSLVLLNLLAIILAGVLLPGCRLGGDRLVRCNSNLKNIGTSLEMYSTDHGGHYPESLSRLTPNYLKTLPQCPSAGKFNYTYVRGQDPDAYTVYCRGCYHHDRGIDTPNYPQYSSSSGTVLPK